MLFDWSYLLNTASRIALGQMPYRDFPLPHAPLTFLTQAAIIRLTGSVFIHYVLYVALVGGLGTVVTWRIAFETLREPDLQTIRDSTPDRAATMQALMGELTLAMKLRGYDVYRARAAS